jgi:hypothetical protein
MLLVAVATPAALADEPAPAAPRFRAGIHLGGGAFFPGPMMDVGYTLAAGAQVNHRWGAYLELGGMGGGAVSFDFGDSGLSQSASAVSFLRVAALGEASFGDVAFVAAGPAVAWGAWTSLNQELDASGASQSATAAAGTMPALDLRGGFVFGKRRPSGRQSGFSLSLDLTFVAGEQSSVSQELSEEGYDASASTGDTVFGTAAMLMLGWTTR